VVAIRTPIPRATSSGIAARTLVKFSGPRISSLGSGSGRSSEIWIWTGRPASGSSAARRRPLNSVALESTTIGRIAASSAISSGIQSSRNGSPPVTPSAVKPKSRASRARATIVAGSSRRRFTPGADSVRQ